MSLNGALQSAVSGLRVAQSSVDLISRNIAQANTEGYTRKTAPQTTRIIDGDARIVLSESVQRAVDSDLLRKIRQESSLEGFHGARSEGLVSIERIFGDPDNAGTLGTKISAMEDAFRELAGSPESKTLQNSVLLDTQEVARALNLMGTEITEERQRAESRIIDTVKEVNDQLGKIKDLNDQIVERTSAGRSTADLEDKRDTLVTDVSESLDITHFEKADGSLYINTADGKALLDQRVRPLGYEPSAITAADSYPDSINPLTLDGQDITNQIRGGRLGGLIDVRDTLLPQAQAQVDEFAARMLMAFRDAPGDRAFELFTDPANGAGFDFDNPPAPPVDEQVGLASRIEVNPAVVADTSLLRNGTGGAPLDASDDRVIREVLDNALTAPIAFNTNGLGPDDSLATGLEGEATLSQFATSAVTFQSLQKVQIDDQYERQIQFNDGLKANFKNDSGVNIDEELSMLIQFQSSYAASARSIQTLQQMYDELLSIV